MRFKILFFILSVYLNIQIVRMNSCERHKTCNKCVIDPDVCVWCAGDSAKPRCRSEKIADNNWCKGSVENPENSTAIPSEGHNRDFSSQHEGIVQIKPQQYDVKLRAGKPASFEFSFQGAKDYPVDLYFLLDASATMQKAKSKIVEHSDKIVRNLKKMTEDVRLAFGTYIDKNAQPFTQHVKKNKSYSFKHHQNFTTKYEEFQNIVRSTSFGINHDSLEGGFDALAQVMACMHLGWRQTSRKIIVFLTDSPHHVAGDGRSAGIFQPYDGKCHTETEGEKKGVYTKELEMDYPSVGTINSLATENKFIILFTLKNNELEPLYKMLLKAIDGSRMAVLSTEDLAEQMKDIYEEISTNVRLEVSDTKNTYEIKFDPDCLDTNTNKDCIVKHQNQLKFAGSITLRKYVTETESIKISIQGVKENLKLNVQVVNKCNCEKDAENNSRSCNQHGTRRCGTCECDANWVGPNCKCENTKDNKVDSELCKAPGDADFCSGSANGICDCDECKCSYHRFGPFCECDKRMCMSNGAHKMCNGQGTCRCNSDTSKQKESCMCREGWSGDYCECLNSKDSCKSSLDDKICSGRGDCICDKCICNKPAPWDKRLKMDELCRVQNYSGFHSWQCTVVSACALCRLASDNCTNKCDGIVVDKIYEQVPAADLNDTAWTVCYDKVESGCYTKFVYKFDDAEYRILLRIQKQQDCAINYYITALIVFATLVLVGILTIIGWKLCTYYQDRKEFLKFEQEHQDILSGPCENPLYDAPTTFFRNPAFQSTKD